MVHESDPDGDDSDYIQCIFILWLHSVASLSDSILLL